MRRISVHRLASLFVAALIAFTISISAVAANDVAVSMGAPGAMASMMPDAGGHPVPQMPGCEKADLCELMCLTSAFTMPSDPFRVPLLDRNGQALRRSGDLLVGMASPLDPSPPRLTHIA